MRMKWWVLWVALGGSLSAASLFPLTDSDPNSPAFQRRFLASFGVNEAIEPKLARQDQALYQKLAPLLVSAPRQAIEMVKKEMGPETNPAFDFLLGNLHYQVREFDQAERALNDAVEKFPSFRRAHRTLALIHVQRGDYGRAIEPLLRVIRLGGGDGQSYGLLGYGYLSNEKYHSALSAYRMARLYEPDSLDFRRGQAHSLLQTQQTEQAIALFDELLAEFPDEKDFWLLQANGFLARGETRKAIANLELVADRLSGDWSMFVLLGDLYLNEALVPLATQSYLRALAFGADVGADQLIRPLLSLVERQHYSEAQQYSGAMDAVPGVRFGEAPLASLELAKAQIEMAVGDPTRAVDRLKQVLKADPLNGDVLLALGEHFLERENWNEAEHFLTLALSVEGAKADALVSLGRLHVAQGQYKAAVAVLRQAQEIQPRSNVAQYLEAVEDRTRAREP